MNATSGTNVTEGIRYRYTIVCFYVARDFAAVYLAKSRHNKSMGFQSMGARGIAVPIYNTPRKPKLPTK
jgi:hypothetical protein